MLRMREEMATLPEDWMGLACFRTRKYDKERTKELIPKYLNALKDFNTTDDVHDPWTVSSAADQYRIEKLRLTGGRDRGGRACINLKLAKHDPKKVSPKQMVRAAALLISNALRGGKEQNKEAATLTQLRGICFLHDLSNVSLSNLDSRIPKLIMEIIMGAFPVRLGAIYIINMPFFFQYILFPVVRLFMSKKLRDRMLLVGNPAKLTEYFEREQLPVEYGGTLNVDVEKMISGLADMDFGGVL